MSSKVRKLHQSYYLPSMAAIGTAIYEDDAAEQLDETAPAHMARIHHETNGVETIEGTYPFTLDTSVRAYRLNRFLHDLIIPEHRRRFLADREAMFEEAGLTEQERAMVRNRDWRERIHYGIIFFMLEKLGAVVRNVKPAYRCGNARAVPRGFPENAECPGSVLGGRR